MEETILILEFICCFPHISFSLIDPLMSSSHIIFYIFSFVVESLLVAPGAQLYAMSYDFGNFSLICFYIDVKFIAVLCHKFLHVGELLFDFDITLLLCYLSLLLPFEKLC